MKRYTYILLLSFLITSQVFLPVAIPATLGYQIDLLLSQVRTASGGVLAGGHVHFYEAGTTTPKDVYTNVNKTGPVAANPYQLTANGTALLYGDGLYRIVIHTSTNVAAYDFDNVRYEDLSSVVARIPRAAIDWGPGATQLPRYYDNNAFTDNLTLYSNDLITKGPWVDVRAYLPAGYVTDGSVDYSTQVQAVLDALQPGDTLLVPITIGLGNTAGGPNKIFPAFPVPVGRWDGLFMHDKTDVTIKGVRGGGFKYLAQPYYHNPYVTYPDGFTIHNSSGVIIEGMKFDVGNFIACALYLDNVIDSSVSKNYFTNHKYDPPSGSGIALLYSYGGNRNEYYRNRFVKGSYGMSFGSIPPHSERNATIIGNIFDNLDRGGIASGVLTNAAIHANVFDDVNVPFNLGGNAGELNSSSNVAVMGNAMRNCKPSEATGAATWAIRTDGDGRDIRGIAYVGNVVDNCGSGAAFNLTKESVMLGNIFRNNNAGYGIGGGPAGKQIVMGNMGTAIPPLGTATWGNGIDISTDNASIGWGYTVMGNQIYGWDNVPATSSAIRTYGPASVSHAVISGNIGRYNSIGIFTGANDNNMLLSNNIMKQSTGSSGTWDFRMDSTSANNEFSGNMYDTIVASQAPTMSFPRFDETNFKSLWSGKMRSGRLPPSDFNTGGYWNYGDISLNYATGPGVDNVLGWRVTSPGLDNAAVWKKMWITLEP